MSLLLDTCTFLWLTAEPSKLSEAACAALAGASSLVLSDCTVLEIALKWRAGKLPLPSPPRTWVETQARTWSLARLNIRRRHIYRSTELAALHRDPFDRLLVAQAIDDSLTIVTPDPMIRRYPVATLW